MSSSSPDRAAQPLQLPPHLAAIGTQLGWSRYGRGRGVGVAIFDSGIDTTEGRARDHLRRRSRSRRGVLGGRDFTSSAQDTAVIDEYGHGTKVAGIVGARVYERRRQPFVDRVYGVAPACAMFNYKVVLPNGRVSVPGLLDAVAFLGQRREDPAVRVVILPFEDEVWRERVEKTMMLTREEGDNVATRIEESLFKDDLLVVVPAGDNTAGGVDLDPQPVRRRPFWPQRENLLVVAAATETDAGWQLMETSNHGVKSVDLAAPGAAVRTTTPMGLATVSGTSVAASVVAGAAAVLFSKHPEAKAAEVAEMMRKATTPLTPLDPPRPIANGLFTFWAL